MFKAKKKAFCKILKRYGQRKRRKPGDWCQRGRSFINIGQFFPEMYTKVEEK